MGTQSLIKMPNAYMEKRQPPQPVVLGKVEIHIQKDETRSLSLVLHRNQSKMGQRTLWDTGTDKVFLLIRAVASQKIKAWTDK